MYQPNNTLDNKTKPSLFTRGIESNFTIHSLCTDEDSKANYFSSSYKSCSINLKLRKNDSSDVEHDFTCLGGEEIKIL
ncbi:MAG TPA: hypothetical protein VGA95_11085 [Thermodesulfobacteriota bacterium]